MRIDPVELGWVAVRMDGPKPYPVTPIRDRAFLSRYLATVREEYPGKTFALRRVVVDNL